MPSFYTCPATCELCGNWLPEHSASCPRNGVHPSQWSLNEDDNTDLTEELRNHDDGYSLNQLCEHFSNDVYTFQ